MLVTSAFIAVSGSPPHMQGKEMPKGLVHRAAGITPRICGEKAELIEHICDYWGSPPRMRGKVSDKHRTAMLVRITPAYAGKSGFS